MGQVSLKGDVANVRQPLLGDSEMNAEGVNSYTSVGGPKPCSSAWGSRSVLCYGRARGRAKKVQ